MNDLTAFPIHGLSIPDLPDVSPVTDGSQFIMERAGTGRVNATAIRDYLNLWFAPKVAAIFATVAALRANVSTLQATAYLEGYASLGDGGQGTFVVLPGDSTTADDGGMTLVDAVGQRWRRQTTDLISVRWFGAKGDGATDDTVAIQAGINAAVAFQLPLYVPSGRYLISAALTINRGCRIFGSYVEPQQALFTVPVTPPNGTGTWIVLDGTHLVSAFFINPSGTPSGSNQVLGVEIDHIAIIHNQPAPAPGWAPRVYPPAIDIPAGSDVYLHDIFLMNPSIGIRAVGQSAGRLTIERISGQPLSTGIILDNQTDTVVVRDVHFWPYWSLDANVLAFQKVSGFGMLLGRLDDPIFENFFCLLYWVGTQISHTANGSTALARFTNCDWNLCGNPFVISDNVGGHTVYMSGCMLLGPGDTTDASGLAIIGAQNGTYVFLSTCRISDVGNNCIANLGTGGINHVRLTACELAQWDIRNTGSFCMRASAGNTIRADAATFTFSVNSPTSVLNGTGGGQCLKEAAQWLSHGNMNGAVSSVTLPHFLGTAPAMMIVTPNGDLGSATKWWITATSADFTVHVNAAPGVDVPFSVLLGLDVFS